MTRSKTIRALTGAALAAWVAVMGMPSSAQANGATPALTFVGLANLPEFPCTPATGEPSCSGNFGGSISGELGGEQFGSWTATLADATLQATFTYNDAEGHCVTGVASGTATMTAGIGNVVGTYKRAEVLPRTVNGLWAQVDFTWQRVGTAAHLTLGNGRVRLDVAGLGWIQVMSGSVGGAVATFVPDLNPDSLPDCVGFTNSPALSATVAGTAVLADPV